MSFDTSPSRLESAFIQRDEYNRWYEEINISGSDLIIYHDENGKINADRISVWASKYGLGGQLIILCAGYTPTTTGANSAEISIPYSPADGITQLTYSIRRLVFRAQTTGVTSPSITFEKSTGTGLFLATSIGTLTIPPGSYETYANSLLSLNSGDKIRFNVTTLGDFTGWTVILEISSLQ